MGFFSRIKEGLSRTRGRMGAQVDELIENTKQIDEDFYEELTDILVMSDIGGALATELTDKLRQSCMEQKITDPAKAREQLKNLLVQEMIAQPMVLKDPSVIFIIGVNGVGKTTSIGKLASRLKTVGRRVVIVAGDTFRAAAAEQLSVWADRAEVPIVRQHEGADPAAVVLTASRWPKRSTRTLS